MIGTSSIFKLTRRAAALTKLLSIFPLRSPRNGLGSLMYFTVKGKAEGSTDVYYESSKRELKTKTIYGFRCDERLKN